MHYRLLVAFVITLALTACGIIPKAPPSAAEWTQLELARRASMELAAQAIVNSRQIADKTMDRMDAESLRRQYEEIRNADDRLRTKLVHSVTTGINPGEDYAGIRSDMGEIQDRTQ